MGYQPAFWRNVVIGLVIVAAVVGAVWMGGSKEKESPVTPPPSPAEKGAKENRAGSETDPKQATASRREERPEEGFRAPNFSLKTLDGKTVELADSKGKPALINFWASWCPPCREEMPHIQEAYETYGERIDFYMVNLTALDNREKMESYLKREKFTFPVLLDETGEVGEMYQTISIPQTYVVNEKGEIVHKIVGSMSKEQLDEIMKQLTD